MRLRISAFLCVLALSSAWSQVATAGGSDTSTAPSAYDILGVSSAGDAGDEAIVVDQALPVEEDPALDNEGPVAEGPAAEDGTVVDNEAVDDEVPAVIDELSPAEAPAAVEEAVPVEEPALVDDGTAADEASVDEESLLAEISRLLEERDTLNLTIEELRAENADLAARVADAEQYKTRAAELEAEISRLEGVIEEKDAALAEADTRLAAIEEQLAEEGARLADAESRLAGAVAGADDDTVSSMIAEKDALIAAKDAEIKTRDQALADKDEELATINARLSAAEAGLAKAKSDLSAAHAAVPAGSAALLARDAAEKARLAAEVSRAEAEAALAAAKASGAVVSAVPPAGISPDAGYLSGWRLDTSRFSKKARDGFDGSAARMGSWKIAGATASQADAAQYFSRLELPLAQGKATTLYRFKARSTGSGWVGLGLHLYVEDVKKKRGYGEGKSLLVWFTRDRSGRGDDATYLQLYRSDDDVVMERMFDAELSDGVEEWRLVEIVYDPAAEYIAVSVDGTLRIVYKTFFGRDSGATVSLRTLGGGASFSDFSVWTER